MSFTFCKKQYDNISGTNKKLPSFYFPGFCITSLWFLLSRAINIRSKTQREAMGPSSTVIKTETSPSAARDRRHSPVALSASRGGRMVWRLCYLSSDPQLLTEAQIPNCYCTHPLSFWQKLCSCFTAAGFHILSPFSLSAHPKFIGNMFPAVCQACDREKKKTGLEFMSLRVCASTA